MLRYQVRFGDRTKPLKGTKFTLGDSQWRRIPCFKYVEICSMLNHADCPNPHDHICVLTHAELDTLLAGRKTINWGELQRAEIHKLDPSVLYFGDIQECWHGLTMVYQVEYTLGTERWMWNYSTPAVREWLKRYINSRPGKYVFLDNADLLEWLILYGGQTRHWISPANANDQQAQYTGYMKQMLMGVNKKVVLNGLRDHSPFSVMHFLGLLDTKPYGIQIENRFWLPDETVRKWRSRVEFYHDWVNICKARKIRLLFAAAAEDGDTRFFDRDFVYQIWLWLHLIDDKNVYYYLNTNYRDRMVDWGFRDLDLGKPLEPVSYNGNLWSRTFKRGQIIMQKDGSLYVSNET